jgi:prepilin-type N-terminal cleavage/methylation domain-containing protein
MRNHNRHGMTLIELLAAIVIIGVLMSLLMPALQKTRQRSRRIKAQAELRELTKAWNAYWYTYEAWPASGTFGMDSAKVDILAGNNPLSIKFMEFRPDALANGLLDPWGNLYTVNLENPTSVNSTWSYSTRVFMAHRQRVGN